MEFKLSKTGTVTECREALNAALAALPVPETQEAKVVRMLAHHIVADHLDPKHVAWQDAVQAARAIRTPRAQGGFGGDTTTPDPTEPQASFAIDCTVTLS